MKKIYICLFAVIFYISSASASSESQAFAMAKNLDIFNSVFKELNLHYVDSIPVEKIVSAGINGMLQKLDPYTNYIPEESEKDFKFMTTGEYGGIGSLISYKDSMVYINEIYEGKPANKAGLLPGDVFVTINGNSIKGKSTSDVSGLLKGTPGTKVTLSINRAGSKKPLKFELTREHIYINPITYYGMLSDSIGYIRLSSFTDDCAEEVKKSIIDLKQKGMKSLILDLRGNPGGLLNEAINICNFFVPKGTTIVSTKGKLNNTSNVYKTAINPIEPTLPLVVMVDEGSASASEIVSGALQDLDRAVIVGERTYGKGLVQSTYPVAYNGQLKVTVAKYYTPSGRCIQAINYTLKDGESSKEIPDSLTNEFKTKNGRIVRDGRGISPDVKIKPEKYKTVTYNLLLQNIIFDYANDYYTKHAALKSIDDYKFSDSDFADFKQFTINKKFKYELQSESYLEDLIRTAKEEDCYESNKAIFDSLTTSLKHDINEDMNKAKDEITEFISYEIIKRYFYHRGELIMMLKSDKILDESLSILNDPKKYDSLLKP
ncbi:MAG: S41 family peptidase [Bacteroidia bacterium]|nr:S41 family peptidase [Bacteroidia bacterium]